jgi:hypothetical protein
MLVKRWIKGRTEFVGKVGCGGEADQEYKQELNHLLKNEE